MICEFNPLHSGHEYAVRSAKMRGADAVIAVMSADFVQRGEAAVMPSALRARTALAAGCDLVIELPIPYSFGSAEYFSRAGVYLADSLGVCDTLFFGSESGDTDELLAAADRLSDMKFIALTDEIQKNDPTVGHMQARADAARRLYGDDFAELISRSNNILALEYIKAARGMKSALALETVKREGSDYNDTEYGGGGYVSASFLRRCIAEGENIDMYVPESCVYIYNEAKSAGLLGADISKVGTAVLSFFRMSMPERLSDIAEISDGLEYRLCRSACEARTLKEFFEIAATKKYTNARLRRAVLSCLLGVMESDFKVCPSYVRVLAANETGISVLKIMKETSKLPIITNVSGFDILGTDAARSVELSRRADALYSLMLPSPLPAGELFKRSAHISKN